MLKSPITFNSKCRGLTLIELLIAMVLGLFVSAVTIGIFTTTVRSNVENMKMIRLNQELRGTMTMMVNELKRHGYSADPTNTDFINDSEPPLLPVDCLRYSYDKNANSTLENDERFGFKLSDNTVSWTQNATTHDCSGTSPDTTWTAITDPNLAKITELTFDVRDSVNTEGTTGSDVFDPDLGSGVSVYKVKIILTGTTDLAFSSDADNPSRTIKETIRIRNEAPK